MRKPGRRRWQRRAGRPGSFSRRPPMHVHLLYNIYCHQNIWYTLHYYQSFISYPQDLVPLLQLVQVSAVVLVDAPSVLCTHNIQLHFQWTLFKNQGGNKKSPRNVTLRMELPDIIQVPSRSSVALEWCSHLHDVKQMQYDFPGHDASL